MPTDMLGREIKDGDIIAYPTTSGRSAKMNIYQVLDAETMKVRQRAATWGWRNSKDSNLHYPDKSIVLDKSLDALLK